MRLSLRISGFKVRGRSRGFSSIVGGIFMVLMAFVIASSYFLWTLSQNTIYFAAVRDKNQFEADRLSENMKVNTTSYAVNTNGSVTVLATLQNTGASSIQLKTVWVYVSNSTWTNYNFSALSNTNVQSGTNFTLSAVLSVSGVNATASYNFASWLITARGNVVTLQQTTLTNNVIVSQVAQGIGSIAFNFEQFWHYDFSGTPAQGTTLPSASRMNYTISESNYTVYHVALTDLDPLGQNIVLNGNSSIYIIGQHSETVKYATWNLVNVTNNKIYPSSGVQYNLLYGVPSELYFSGAIGSSIDPNNPYPLNILLCGTKGNNDYGQNIPFVSIYLVP